MLIREELYRGLLQAQNFIREDTAGYFERDMLFNIGICNDNPTKEKPIVDAMVEVHKAISALFVLAEGG